MLVHTSVYIIRDADVKRGFVVICKDIDVLLFVHFVIIHHIG